MIRYLAILLCAGCATVSAQGLPPFPPAPKAVVKPLMSPKAVSLKSRPKLVALKSASFSSPKVVVGGAHCFNFFFDRHPISEPPFPAYTNAIWSWDHLVSGQYYRFQTSKNLTTWLTREEGLWTGSLDDYFEIALPESAAGDLQRVFGGPPPPQANLVQPAATAVRVLQVHHRSELKQRR